jgi:ATP synthase proteolipid subunit
MSLSDPQLLTGLGAALAIFLTATGSAIASAKVGVYCLHKHSIKAFVPIIQAGVLAIYGIVIAVLLTGRIDKTHLSPAEGYRNLLAGLCVGLAYWASGMGMVRFLKYENTTTIVQEGQQPSPPNSEMTQPLVDRECTMKPVDNFRYHTMVMIFLESVGLYGLVAALFLIGKN